MPKRSGAAAQGHEPVLRQSEQHDEQEDHLQGEDLDLSSDEDIADGDAVGTSGYEESEDPADGSDSDEDDVREALAEYMEAARAERLADAVGDRELAESSGRYDEAPADSGSDSSEDERPNRNTVGKVPLKWYKDEDHIGYDIEGQMISKKKRGDKLDSLLARNDSKKALRTIYDEYNDEEIVLSKEELAMIMRLRKGQFPHIEVNPYEPYIDYFSGDVDPTPLINAPAPKRRFTPSKWEEKKIVKLVRAIRKGWIKVGKQRPRPQERSVYLLWGDDDQASGKQPNGLTYIPPAKLKLPGHEESYNPPKEYIPTEEEKASHQLLPPEEQPKFIPQAFDCLRHVPHYADFIKERFERCLDLYLCPRVRKKRMFIDPKTLMPKLPKPQDLQPFPTTLSLRFSGHTSRVRSISPHPSGQWLASGSDDGTVRLWEVSTGRCCKISKLDGPVSSVAWCPNPALQLIAAAVGNKVVLLVSGIGGDEVDAAARQACQVSAAAAAAASQQQQLAQWITGADGTGLELVTGQAVKQVTWHARGDYFASVAPTGQTQVCKLSFAP
eukprot:GHRR01016656.1.p1 GENE.GHRR01016656.1~~GHRR01016656.1.p1  ORF type:complete len:555 (+),score=167.55 GHRR01016656.1:411-2075(+)